MTKYRKRFTILDRLIGIKPSLISPTRMSVEITKQQVGSVTLTARGGKYDGNSVIVPDFPIEAAYFNANAPAKKKNSKDSCSNAA